MSWPYSRISTDWQTATAMAPNGKNVVVFAQNMYEVNSEGEYTYKGGTEWRGTVAATTLGNFIYAIRPDGFIYKINTSSYATYIWAEVDKGWENAKAIFAYNDRIYVVLNSIWELRLDGTFYTIQPDNLGQTRSMTVIGDYAYSVHDSGYIYKTNLKDWTYKILSSGWNNTFQLLQIDNKLFAYDEKLTIIDTNIGAQTVVHADYWISILTGAATTDAMYTVCNGGILWNCMAKLKSILCYTKINFTYELD